MPKNAHSYLGMTISAKKYLWMPTGDYEWLKCPWILRNFPKDNLAEKSTCHVMNTSKSPCPIFSRRKKVNIPWHMHRFRITHKYCEVPKSLRIDKKACSLRTLEIMDNSKFEVRHLK